MLIITEMVSYFILLNHGRMYYTERIVILFVHMSVCALKFQNITTFNAASSTDATKVVSMETWNHVKVRDSCTAAPLCFFICYVFAA